MDTEIQDLSDTIVPKSDQLNADDLIAGPITVTINSLRRGNSRDQPLDLHIEGQRPYKPCKSMRRVLIAVWGNDGREWIGRSMRLYRDPEVTFGGVIVGGIRISHMSHIAEPMTIVLTVSRGKRKAHRVDPLEDAPATSNGDADTIANGEPKSIDAMSQREIVDAMRDGGLLGEAKAAREHLELDPEDKSVDALRAIYRHVLSQMP